MNVVHRLFNKTSSSRLTLQNKIKVGVIFQPREAFSSYVFENYLKNNDNIEKNLYIGVFFLTGQYFFNHIV